jgi:iron(III) transport system ATP-binding protein
MSVNDTFLVCENLSKRFDGVQAVKDVDLQVGRGDILGLLGPSGCGKTTLLRLLAGFEMPDSGRIELAGRTLSGPNAFVAPEKRHISLVFQDYALFPHLSVASNITFGMSKGGDKRRRVEELLSLVGLDGKGQRMPHELSGGEQQRVALARALAAQPEIILLDEPFSNLDQAMRARVRAEVRQLLESLGVTAIFVTHDQEEALSLAKRVAVMMDGRILQTGEPQEIYCQPADRLVAEFLGDANFLPAEIKGDYLTCELGRVPTVNGYSGPIEVMVRPEKIAVAPESGCMAEVVGMDFYGHDQMLTMRLPSGRLVKIRTMPTLNVSLGEQLGLQLRGDVVPFLR